MDKETKKTGTITRIDREKGGIYIKPDDNPDNNIEYFAHIGDTLENEQKILRQEIPFKEGDNVTFSIFVPNKPRAMHVERCSPSSNKKNSQ